MSEWRELARRNTTLPSGFDNLAFKAVWLNSPSSYTISVIYFFFKKYIGNKKLYHICELAYCVWDESEMTWLSCDSAIERMRTGSDPCDSLDRNALLTHILCLHQTL